MATASASAPSARTDHRASLRAGCTPAPARPTRSLPSTSSAPASAETPARVTCSSRPTASGTAGARSATRTAWLRCSAEGQDCNPIDGAFGTAYLVSAADVGKKIRSQVEAANAYGATISTSYAVGPAVGPDDTPPPPPPPDDPRPSPPPTIPHRLPRRPRRTAEPTPRTSDHSHERPLGLQQAAQRVWAAADPRRADVEQQHGRELRRRRRLDRAGLRRRRQPAHDRPDPPHQRERDDDRAVRRRHDRQAGRPRPRHHRLRQLRASSRTAPTRTAFRSTAAPGSGSTTSAPAMPSTASTRAGAPAGASIPPQPTATRRTWSASAA